jgi:fructuronate reductase
LDEGKAQKGIVAAFTLEPEVIDSLWKHCDNLSLAVTLNPNGTMGKKVIGSVSEALYADESSPDWARMKAIFENPSLQMVSFTITEKGYGDTSENSAMYKVAQLLYTRWKAGALPVAMVSMDNVSHNGDKLKNGVFEAAKILPEAAADPGFQAYIRDASKVSFPWTMIDKITPSPDPQVAETLQKLGFEEIDTIRTDLGTFASTFVNAESAQYLVIEDSFPNGRPPLEDTGVIFTDRNTVDLTEKMKVSACLNPLHTTLSIFGSLLGIGTIAGEMLDPDIRRMVVKLGYRENLPMVVNPHILNPEDFLRECVEERFPNPFMRDTPFRIVMDTSAKMSVRYGITIKAYQAKAPEKLAALEVIPFTLAGWCRYLMGIDDNGQKFELSPDPMLPQLTPHVKDIRLGQPCDVHAHLQPILSRADIFGLNLYDTPLAAKAEGYFAELIAGPGAVRKGIQNIGK